MKTSIKFRLCAAICAAILFVGASSFITVSTLADDVLTKPKKAVDDAKTATDDAGTKATDADEAEKKAAASDKKSGKKKSKKQEDAEAKAKEADDKAKEAAKTADNDAKAADKAQEKAQQEEQEAKDAEEAAKNAGSGDKEKQKEAEKQRGEATDAEVDAKAAEGTAADSEKASNEADQAADNAGERIENRDVKKKRKAARDARRLARALRRAAAKGLRDASDALHEQAKKDGKEPSSKTKGLVELLKELKKDLEGAGKPADTAKQGTIVPESADETVQTKTANGLRTVTFDTSAGRVKVNLPDDMMAGDTISGTVIAEPKGQTKEEQAKNQSELNGMVIEIDHKRVQPFSGDPQKEREGVIQQTFWIYHVDEPKVKPAPNAAPTSHSVPISLVDSAGKNLAQTTIPIWSGIGGMTPSGAVITPDPKMNPTFNIPTLGQAGRPIVITGPFDGNSSNTTLTASALLTNVQDFEKNTEKVSAGFGSLAESERRAVIQSSSTVTGPIQITLKEGNTQTTGTYRNVGVNLTAPKTTLLKGEKTELRVEVSGLQGITQPVPLTLESHGVITMVGGNSQPLMIQPSQVGADGRYSTTRGITGVQAGGWTATATVETNPAPRGGAKTMTQNERDALEEEAHNMTKEQLDARLEDLGHKLETEGKNNGNDTETDKYKRLKEELDIFNAERRKRK